ncbi:oxidoreductase [Amantichitinum ursilacus]|uniref:Fatty acyl-CoA reductase n=1 Tax=Amantichitinum ursilacus TaxID=857265 RepID=A0A0N0XI17_9NEIS|nr:oxidoreductase [Amantichitinum ursilacus]KPC51962.1 Fatty acyl-CoA reductase [Amantichitinum ursilacus]
MTEISAWRTRDIPSQNGRHILITGATGGLGYETAMALAGAGADVLLTGRNASKGAAALAHICQQHPQARVQFEHLDLASLNSVRDFAHAQHEAGKPIDVLINNAGVMMPPKRTMTVDGFELQLGTNYLGHYALTALLLPLLRGGNRPRVVSLASVAHRRARIHFDDLQAQRRYHAWRVYGQSKLALLLFALELQRHSARGNWGIASMAAHPGYASTDLFHNAAGTDSWLKRMTSLVQPWVGQSAAAGALPTLYAASAADAVGGAYYGPDGWQELKGNVQIARVARYARDKAVAARLWQVSAELTGVTWPTP